MAPWIGVLEFPLHRGVRKFEGFEQLEKDHSGVQLQVASIVLFLPARDNEFASPDFRSRCFSSTKK
jgi:hypothetical protein